MTLLCVILEKTCSGAVILKRCLFSVLTLAFYNMQVSLTQYIYLSISRMVYTAHLVLLYNYIVDNMENKIWQTIYCISSVIRQISFHSKTIQKI